MSDGSVGTTRGEKGYHRTFPPRQNPYCRDRLSVGIFVPTVLVIPVDVTDDRATDGRDCCWTGILGGQPNSWSATCQHNLDQHAGTAAVVDVQRSFDPPRPVDETS